ARREDVGGGVLLHRVWGSLRRGRRHTRDHTARRRHLRVGGDLGLDLALTLPTHVPATREALRGGSGGCVWSTGRRVLGRVDLSTGRRRGATHTLTLGREGVARCRRGRLGCLARWLTRDCARREV